MGFCYERQMIINYRLTIYVIMSGRSKQYKGKQGKRGCRGRKVIIFTVWSGKTSLRRWHLQWGNRALDALHLLYNAQSASTVIQFSHHSPGKKLLSLTEEETVCRWLNDYNVSTELGLNSDRLSPSGVLHSSAHIRPASKQAWTHLREMPART